MKIVLSTLPAEGEFVNWTTPKYFAPKTLKYMPLGILSLASNLPKAMKLLFLILQAKVGVLMKPLKKQNQKNPISQDSLSLQEGFGL